MLHVCMVLCPSRTCHMIRVHLLCVELPNPHPPFVPNPAPGVVQLTCIHPALPHAAACGPRCSSALLAGGHQPRSTSRLCSAAQRTQVKSSGGRREKTRECHWRPTAQWVMSSLAKADALTSSDRVASRRPRPHALSGSRSSSPLGLPVAHTQETARSLGLGPAS